MRKLIFVCIFTIFTLSALFGISAVAAEKSYTADKIFTISKGGDTSDFPQYSKEAIESCIDLGFDAVSLEIGKDTLPASDLGDIIELTKNKILVILDCDENELDTAFDAVKEKDSLNEVYFRSRDMKNKNLLAWAESKDGDVNIIPSYDGNVIFSAISAYNFAEENTLQFCEFSSKNRYGVIFSEFFAGRFDNAKALIPISDKDSSGQRNDSLHGWESVLSLGYSAIETENAKEFADYISLLDESYNHLEKIYSEAKATDLTPYSSTSTKDFEKYVFLAEEMLTSEKPSSQLEINECIENIEISRSKFQLSEGEEENKTFVITPMKIFWIAFALALFISSQLYLHRKTEKSS